MHDGKTIKMAFFFLNMYEILVLTSLIKLTHSTLLPTHFKKYYIYIYIYVLQQN